MCTRQALRRSPNTDEEGAPARLGRIHGDGVGEVVDLGVVAAEPEHGLEAVALVASPGKYGNTCEPEIWMVGHGFWPVTRRQSRRSAWIVSANHTFTCARRQPG